MTAAVPIRTLIVDDEPVARQVLREELRGAGDIEIVGEAEDGAAALAAIAEHRPELVFLDLKMPGLGGFEVVRRLPEGVLPVVVIVTAYDEHAIRAYEAGALDYLLKPVSQERLNKALDRVRALRGRTAEVAESLVRLDDAAGHPAGRGRKVVGRSGAEFYLLDLDDVLAFQAEREIVWILTGQRRYMATQTLQAIAARLAGSVFQRVHRGALVNVNHVRKMTPLSSQRWMLTLSNGSQFTVSKRLAKAVREALQW
ncbi:MAG: response regulator transcription factor [Acidobacteria bacterium]|nr:response regulator transcription factor [Acidobacteriota bacterium]